MPTTRPRPVRAAMRLPDWDYRRADWYFVTIGTKRHTRSLAHVALGRLVSTEAGRVVGECWTRLHTLHPEVSLDAWVVMPDHFHALIRPAGVGKGQERGPGRPPEIEPRWRSGSLGVLINHFKRGVTVTLRQRGIPWPGWHRGYHDRVVRDPSALIRIRRYIGLNPVRYLARHGGPAPTHADGTGAL